jgi:hypothetical protein
LVIVCVLVAGIAAIRADLVVAFEAFLNLAQLSFGVPVPRIQVQPAERH